MNLRQLDLIVRPEGRAILNSVKTCTSFAVIAGGYLRDQYYGVPYKDIDVFVSSDLDIAKLRSLFSDYKIGYDVEDDEAAAKYDKSRGYSILNLAHETKTPIQIMQSSDFTSVGNVLKGFDFGFCQIAYDGQSVQVSDAFWKDAADNTVTFLLGEKSKAHSHHEDRLRKKYPNLVWTDTPTIDD